MEILLIRHGQSEADLLDVHEGRADFPLTELGRAQAEKMANYVSTNFPADVILASPLKRAKETALILQNKLDCEIKFEPDLMEFNNGVLAGLSREEARLKYPLPKGGRPIFEPIQEGESELEFRFRAERVFHKILFEYKDVKRIAIVSHGGMISNLLKSFLKLPIDTDYAFITGDTGIHLLLQKEDKRIIKFLNNLSHLTGDFN